MSELRIEPLEGGPALAARFDALAAVRIAVFRDFPYLYEGSLDNERHYLDTYFASPRSFAALAWDGERCIGATTAIPLSDADDAARQPFVDAGESLDGIDYFGESVLLPAYRGRGIGVRFFELREAHARRHGLRRCAFCAVDRAADHPARPPDYVPNDAFWTRRGYRRMPSLVTRFEWVDVGDSVPTSKAMTFWCRDLAGDP